jgi:hypothetical protein
MPRLTEAPARADVDALSAHSNPDLVTLFSLSELHAARPALARAQS